MINWALIVINIVVFSIEIVYTRNFNYRETIRLFSDYGLVPYNVLSALDGHNVIKLFTLVSSMFIHANLLHIFGNMLYLFVFGDNVEDTLGHSAYLLFYLLAGMVGALAQVYFSVLNGPPDIYAPSVGASGAISGVLAAYLLFFPRARIVSIVGYFIIPVRAVWFIGFWFLLQVFYVAVGANTGVAYIAHIGGFIAGLVVASFARLFIKGRDLAYYG